ncbi:MAG: amidohydrolase family protein [Gemmatimonas sp.]|nr:amidohydrolase family protein [Gemmatimonas sp.]
MTRRLRSWPALPLLTLLAASACAENTRDSDAADLVLIDGKVVTMDPALPEAEAVAISGDLIVAVGSSEEIREYVGPETRTIELDGRLVTPGFIEGHGHFMSLGESKLVLDLTTATSWEEIVAMVADAAAEAAPGEWILGRGWHQEKWTSLPSPSVEGNPVHTSLSAASPANPVGLTHASGHASFVNAQALELAGITRETPNPDGGEIVRDASGTATGLLRETAQRLADAALAEVDSTLSPEETRERRRRIAQLAGEEALANGVTSFHDAGVPFATIDFYRELADDGELPVRLYVMVREPNEALAEQLPNYRLEGYGGGFLTVRSIKRQIDGALGSHGAWLLEPYEDLPRSAGLNLESVDDLEATAQIALEHSFQLNTHAIGDRANREVLDVYERAFESAGNPEDSRWRIEHAQHLHPSDITRFGELGVIAAMQGVHATSDGSWVPDRIGAKRAEEGAYVWRSLLDAGVTIANGTDVPVERIDPIANLYSTVARRLADGSVFHGDQRLTREEALESYTINNAFAAFEEDLKGSITPGKLADLVVLSQDLLTIPEEAIPATRVLYTIVGGAVRYASDE